MTSFDDLTHEKKVRATIHRDVNNICAETCHFLGLEISKDAVEVIAELVFKKVSVYGTDLEAFAKHAKRQTINADDVKLLVRRNPSLLAHISKRASSFAPKEKRRKTGQLPNTKQTDSPTVKQNNDTVVEKSKVTEDNRMEISSCVEEIDLTFDD